MSSTISHNLGKASMGKRYGTRPLRGTGRGSSQYMPYLRHSTEQRLNNCLESSCFHLSYGLANMPFLIMLRVITVMG